VSSSFDGGIGKFIPAFVITSDLSSIFNIIPRRPIFGDFESKTFTEAEQLAALAFWEGKNIDDVPSLDLIMDTGKDTATEFAPAGTPVPRGEYGNAPYKFSGKLLFTTPRGGASCTASAMGNNGVLTAGHCVHDGSSAFFTNIIFIPQFYQGAAPHGRWAATQVFTTNEWARSGGRGFSRDVGCFRTNSQGGRTLEQTVGKSTPLYSVNHGKSTISIGYPGNIGGGQEMIRAISPQEAGDNMVPPTNRLRSTKTFGASGGPWFINNGANVNGVNSYIKSNPSTHLYSPRFDAYIGDLLKRAL